jgi:hypothetical protein
VVLAPYRVSAPALEVAEDRLDPRIPLLGGSAVVAIRRRLGEQALEPSDSEHRNLVIEILEPFRDPFIERRPPRNRGELDDAAAVALLALLVRARANATGETTSLARLAEAAEATPPDGVDERQLVPEDGRHASTVGSGPSNRAHDSPGRLRKFLRPRKLGLG